MEFSNQEAFFSFMREIFGPVAGVSFSWILFGILVVFSKIFGISSLDISIGEGMDFPLPDAFTGAVERFLRELRLRPML
ncbi:MAG: hypothetical protein ACD_78C00439G0008 [uncultured bacterium (gcode 4)]|uniref:Uncharacterized protein n=1 Tax=uncultured bacterium (gcode 4) TaxID=1234023 RepID=K1XGG0_9BACT|nr:MAG: hypothetical protein ACD_78C00439G0008 [uncultured bacterium (gcode 4)]